MVTLCDMLLCVGGGKDAEAWIAGVEGRKEHEGIFGIVLGSWGVFLALSIFRNTLSAAGNCMSSSERPSPEPIQKKKRPQPYWGGDNSGNALETSNALNYRVWGIPAVLSRGIPGNALRAFPGSFRNSSGISSGNSQPYWGYGPNLGSKFGEGECNEAEISEKESFSLKEVEAFGECMRVFVKISAGMAIQWRGSGHSVSRWTLKAEALWPHPLPKISSSESQRLDLTL